MAPEQLEGKRPTRAPTSSRSARVLYEMLTGRKAFEGKTPGEPDRRDSERRTAAGRRRSSRSHPPRSRPRRQDASRKTRTTVGRPRATVARAPVGGSRAVRAGCDLTAFDGMNALRIAAAVIVLAAIGGYAAWTLKPAASQSEGVTRFSVTLPEAVRLTGGVRRHIAMSPDGSRIVLTANDQLYLRSMADEEFHPIAGTDQNPGFPFFSPDGQWLVFWSLFGGGTLKKIPVTAARQR